MRFARAVDRAWIAHHACMKAAFGKFERRLLRSAGKVGFQRRTIAFEGPAAIGLDETVGDYYGPRGTLESFPECPDGARVFSGEFADPRYIEAERRVNDTVRARRAFVQNIQVAERTDDRLDPGCLRRFRLLR